MFSCSSQSFRFGRDIAQIADVILRSFKFTKKSDSNKRNQIVADKTLLGVGPAGGWRTQKSLSVTDAYYLCICVIRNTAVVGAVGLASIPGPVESVTASPPLRCSFRAVLSRR